MKKILIFYGSYGGGHLAAAKAIESHLKETYGDEVDILNVDCIEYINKYINKVSTDAYKELAKKAPWIWKHVYKNSQYGALSHISNTTNKLMSYKLNQLIKEFRPDLIISTHPFSTQMCAILKEKKKFSCKVATILTDYHIHAQWLVKYEYIDYFFVSNDQMKVDMISEGVRADRIYVTGIPVSERFSGKFNDDKTYEEFGLSKDRKTVLFFAGGEFGLGRNNTFMTLKALIRLFRDVQVVAISGKNKKMNKRFKELVESTESEDRVKILEYTNKVPELMHISEGVITKAGGLTISECLVSNKPICIINPIPGQEEENAEFLIKKGVAVWIKKGDNIARILKTLSRNPEKLKEMAANAKLLAKPYSTKNICEILTNDITDLVKMQNVIAPQAIVECNNHFIFKTNRLSTTYDLLKFELKKDEEIEELIGKGIQDIFGVKPTSISPLIFNSRVKRVSGKPVQYIYLTYLVNADIDVGKLPKEYNYITKTGLSTKKYSLEAAASLKKLNLL